MVRVLFRVIRHTAVAYVAAGLLGAVGMVAMVPGGIFAREDGARPYGLEVRLATDPLPDARTAPLLGDVGREVTPHVTVRVRADGTWLVVFSASAVERNAANRALRPVLARHGFPMTTLRLSSALSEWVTAAIEDPVSEAARYAALMPALVAFGGAGFILTAWFFRRRHPAGDWEIAAIPAARAAIVGVGVGLAGLAVVTGLTSGLAALGAPVAEQGWVDATVQQGGVAFTVLFVLAVVVAPVGEELLFRGHLFRHLAAHGFRLLAYGFSALTFAAAHGNNPSGLPAYVAYGLVLAWSFERWRSILVPIVAHATVNALSLGLLAWQA